MTYILSIPEQGQIVDVRGSRFVVTNVLKNDYNDVSTGNIEKNFHLVRLSSLVDDALGEELNIIWELEPGSRVYEKITLPEPIGFDSPKKLDAFLDAVRWGAASSADSFTIQSPFRSGIEIEDYQLDPVVRAIQMPRANLLIADDVGLGKTIESGLVIQELLIRHRIRNVLIICPSSLQIQWKEQMRDKFGLEFHIVDSTLMKQLRRERGIRVNPWTHYPRLITSIDYIKREAPMRLLKEILPPDGEPTFPRKIDMLVIDEAHSIAPSGSGAYAVDSMRTKVIKTIAPHCEHKLFLTATPHNGYRESFTALLEILDNQRFARGIEPDRKQLQSIMIRRLKSELPPAWDGSSRFQRRILEEVEVPYTDEEKEIHLALKEYTDLRKKGALDNLEKYATEFVLKLVKKRLFSSPASFYSTLEKHILSLENAKRHKLAQNKKTTLSVLQKQLDIIDDEDFDNDDEYFETTSEVIESATNLFRELSERERFLLNKMRVWAEKASKKPDSKANELIKWIETNLLKNGEWTDNRVVIFTEYRDTMNWLWGIFATEKLTRDGRIEILSGGMNSDEREKIKASFQAHPDKSKVRILLATDAASEGIDLQNHCNRLFHYEIPWNPNRMEQRNGRIDRHGQQLNPLIFHFVGKGYNKNLSLLDLKPGSLEGDLEFLMHAARKVDNIREDLGKVGPVIASQVEEAMLGIRKTLDTNKAENDAQPGKKLLKFERDLRANIEKLIEQLRDSKKELRLSPENIKDVVSTALELAGQPPLIETELKGIFPDPKGKRKITPVFKMPALKGSWAICNEGLEHPHTKEIRAITFDPDLIKNRDDLVLVHLNHRLVQMCLKLLRAEVWSQKDKKALYRVTARIVPNNILETPAVIAHSRLVVIGGNKERLHEEIIHAGGFIKEGRFKRIDTEKEKNDIMDSAFDEEPSNEIKNKFVDLWTSCKDPLIKALEARMESRFKSLKNKIEEKSTKEADDITKIMNELLETIKKELNEPEFEQLEIKFTELEKDQLKRDKESLKHRMEKIPSEIEKEVKAIKNRFSDPTPRIFPVAVTWYIPERFAK